MKVYQYLTGEQRKQGDQAKLVHTATVSAFTRDAAAKTRELLASQGYHVHKLSFAPNNAIIVAAAPISPVQLQGRRPLARAPKVRIVRKSPAPEQE